MSKLGNIGVFVVILILLSASSIYAGNKVLFEIGKQDNSASEFALYPDNYKSFLANFGGEKSFYVGYSTPDKHWPYVLPGPLDSWAGGGYWAGFHPRHFELSNERKRRNLGTLRYLFS